MNCKCKCCKQDLVLFLFATTLQPKSRRILQIKYYNEVKNMKQTASQDYSINLFRFFVPVIAVVMILAIAACEKDDTPDFNPDFSFENVDDNHVKFTNNSSGQYFWIIYDYDNGTYDSLTDKNAQPVAYFPAAGSYDVTMTLINSYGSSKSVTKTVSISNDDLNVDFTVENYDVYPNFVQITNTTTGIYEFFTWSYEGKQVDNVETFTEYFPFAGDYEIQLTAKQGSTEVTESQIITIVEDDPDYDPNLIWREEFIHSGGPDQSKWNYEIGNGSNGWGNNELQYYTDSDENSYVDNGMLTITAREEPVSGFNYSSARLTTQNKFDFRFGRIEARIKLPYGQGLWPAFWMLGANFNQVGWPQCGEIDIMEMVGGVNRDNTCHTTIHWWDETQGARANYGESYTLPSGIFADDFHVFGVEWDEQTIRGYVDGNEYYVVDLTPSEFSEFKKNFFIILNVAVGGEWPGEPDETTVFPQTMQVDWVRVYSQ